VISISIDDDAADSKAAIRSFLKKAKPSFTVLHDPKTVSQRAFGVEGIPMNVALDGSGKIIATAGGDAGALDRAMAALARTVRASRAPATPRSAAAARR
jgi:hypothetical protein